MAKIKVKKKTKRTLIIGSISIILFVLFMTYGVPFLLKVNFLLGSGLIVKLSPESRSLDLEYGEDADINFEITTHNSVFCSAKCDYTFFDQSKGELIDEGSFELDSNGAVSKNYNIGIDKLGSGQDIYNFQVSCNNIRNYLCFKKDEDIKVSSSLIIVNYNLSGDLNEVKQILKENVTLFLKELEDTDKFVQKIDNNVQAISSKGDFEDFVITNDVLKGELDLLRVNAENFHTLWSQENYIQLNEDFSHTFFDNLSNLRKQAEELDNDFRSKVEIHNDIVGKTNEELKKIDGMISLIPILNLEGDITPFLLDLEDLVDDVNDHTKSILDISFENYDVLEEDIVLIKEDVMKIKNISDNVSMFYYINGRVKLQREEDYLCAVEGECSEFSLDKIYSDILDLEDIGSSEKIGEVCGELRDINRSFEGLRSDKEFNPFVKAYGDLRNRDIIIKRENGYVNSFIDLDETEFLEVLGSSLGGSEVAPIEIEEDLEENSTRYLLSKIDLSLDSHNYLDGICSQIGLKNPIEDLDVKDIEILQLNESLDYESTVVTELSDNPPECCFFGECKACCNTEECKNDPDTFPIVFVHGHAVRRSNSVEYSLNSFNSMQKKLEKDGYLNAGVLLNSGTEGESDLGLSGKPVSVRVTYYYDIFRGDEGYTTVPTKSESIDTYALRLNDLVEIVKKRTGKPKVNIISFSMGGLVSRKYIQIFGDDSVNKLVTIGTPNQGIFGRVSGVCPVLGESKECEDMQVDSLFLNKLNDPENQPSNVKIYTIIGRGCDTDGRDGDGVVRAESASLKGVVDAKEYFVNGTCPRLIPQIHSGLVKEYPEVYGFLSEILKE